MHLLLACDCVAATAVGCCAFHRSPQAHVPLVPWEVVSSASSTNKLFFDLAITGMPAVLDSQPSVTKEKVLLGLAELRAQSPLDRGKALKEVSEVVTLLLQVRQRLKQPGQPFTKGALWEKGIPF